ncbi:MAG TPA: hypothetical protein PK752_18295 [Accumulibacter sp.]|uniref:hypothetical protein n=1 Tax=Accumulibacter sp. TaxID=2053492 RepID=UPI002B5396C2|nr:hypothetical protein [Accumulibacter sp.]HRD90185.1 hypothetical protein [Accumulibacter sp.]
MATSRKEKGEMQRGEIHLGDLIRALGTLHCQDHEHARAIAGCLGFGLAAPEVQPTRPTPMVYDRSRLSAQPKAEPAAVRRPEGFDAPATRQPKIDLPAQTLKSTLNAVEVLPAADLAGAAAWLASDYQRLDPTPGVSPPRRTLIPAETARGVFTAALATRCHGDRLDVDRLVRRVVEGRLPPRLPRLHAATLARGCQLLLDFGGSMLPWWEDLRELAKQLAAVLGEGRVSVFDFDSSPGQAGRWLPGKDQQQRWRPEPGRPILAATDFGIQGLPPRSRPDAGWKELIEDCRAQGCPLIVLVPWSPEYWPTTLGPDAELVHWNPRTSAAMLSRQIGGGRRPAR